MSTQTPIKALFLLATLKSGSHLSHTHSLCEILEEDLKCLGIKSEIIRLANYNIKPGTTTHVYGGDDWEKIVKKIRKTDILIFATPVWWGMQSSLMQRIIERMDELNEKLMQTGESDLGGKVGGIVITGDEDGAQHIIGNLANFIIWNGLTLPPACSLSHLKDVSDMNKESLHKYYKSNKAVRSVSRIMAMNLNFFARLLKGNPLPKIQGMDQNMAG